MPGYKELFGDPNVTYDELVQSMPSRVVLDVAISLNNELNASIDEERENLRCQYALNLLNWIGWITL